MTRPPVFVVVASSALWLLAITVTAVVVIAERAVARLLGGNR